MNLKNQSAVLSLVASFLLVGCGNVGEAPSGSEQAVKDQFASMKPEEKIKFIQSSPMPAAEKQQRIDEIKKQAGITGDTPPPANQAPQHG